MVRAEQRGRATFPDLVLVVVIDPVDLDHTAVTIYSMAKGSTSRRAQEATQEQRAGSLLARGGIEDNEMSAGVQRGWRAGANAFVEFGRHESAIGHFHATLDACLGASAGRA